MTRAADAHLLRMFLASYQCFWKGEGKLILFTRRADSHLWSQIDLPPGTRLVYREDYPELGVDDFRNQLYLKLVSHRLVDTEHYVVMDSDFLFVSPCPESAFFHQGKPIWFSRDWDEVADRWRAGSEALVGAQIDRLYMSAPQYVMSRAIAAELARRYDLRRMLEMSGVSEYVVYGWFARTFFPDRYHWVDLQPDHFTPVDPGEIAPIGRKVNQVPPSYCRLDPQVSLDEFPGACYLAFWSHWDLAEAKMMEFLLEAHRRHPDRPLQLPQKSRIYPLITLPATPQTLYSEMRGLYLDGWVKEEVWFAMAVSPSARQLNLYFEVPSGPLGGSWQTDTGAENPVQFSAGNNTLAIPLQHLDSPHQILLRFDAPPTPVLETTGRLLRARLIDVRLDL